MCLVVASVADVSVCLLVSVSDVIKDTSLKGLTLKTKARTKDLTLKAKDTTKDLTFKAKDTTKDLTLKTKARTKGLTFKAKARTTRPRLSLCTMHISSCRLDSTYMVIYSCKRNLHLCNV